MSGAPHQLLLASAGTGKTWQLTNRYLELLLLGTDPARILASTFTRKAAGEIQERVLERLVAGASEPAARAQLAQALGRPELSAGDCRALLARVARSLERLRVRTIDSFFAELAQAFALELALPPTWRIADEREEEELASEGIARVLAEAPAEQRLELLRAIQRESGARSVHEALLGIVRSFRAAGRDAAPGAWRVVRAQPGPSKAEYEGALLRMAELPLPANKDGKPNANWKKAMEQLLSRARSRELDALLDATLVQNARSEDPRYYGKQIPPELVAELGLLARHAVAELVARIEGQNRAVEAFLERYERARSELLRERGALAFDDVPFLLAGESIAGAGEELAFRLDASLDHVLLDEFQDTAPLQWRVLEPLVEELLADGSGTRSFFCVGDVKQSIYGWRSAEPALLAGLAGRYAVLRPRSLARSFRSARVVLDTVNSVFAGLGTSPALAADEVGLAAAASFVAGFEQHVPAKELPGFAWMLEAREPAEGEKRVDPVIELALERVAALAAEAPSASIAVLMRRNELIPRLLAGLLARGIRASGEGGNPLTDSEAVLAFLALAHLADHPGDSAAAFHVASSPFGPHLGLVLEECPERADLGRRAAELSRDLRRRIASQGYGPLAASLLPLVESQEERWSAWDRRRFARLVELGFAFDARVAGRPIDFAEHVRSEPVEEAASAGVRVMTVHRAKGLEFDAVVLPELDQPLWKQQDKLLSRRADPYGAIDALSVGARKALCALDPTLGALRAEVGRRATQESLSLLYVGLTRAARRLELVVAHKKPEAKPSASYAWVLRGALAQSADPARIEQWPAPSGARVLWVHPDSSADWAAGLAAERSQLAQAPEPLLRLAPERAERLLASRSPSGELRRGTDARALLGPRSTPAMRRGSLVHRWLEELEWIEDFALGDEELLALGADIEADRAARADALAELRAALARPQVRAALSRAERAAPALEVWRERRFCVVLPDESGRPELWSGSFDRVVLERDPSSGTLLSARIQDYKTDAAPGERLAEIATVYRPQMDAYRRIAAHITGLAHSAIRCSLVFLHAGRVVEC